MLQMTKTYSQLNLEQRYQIHIYRKAGYSNCQIAKELDVHKSTIGREILRNSSSSKKYNPRLAQQFATDRKADKPHFHLFDLPMKDFIEEKMQKEQWSPDQISGYCSSNNIEMVSHETIYKYVYADIKKGGKLYLHLRTRCKKRKNRTHLKDKRGLITDRVSIHHRPAVVAQKQRFGDWEIDLIEGANHKNFALTMVERKSQFALIFKTQDKQAATIQNKIINGLAPYKELVHTITSDNGKEFAGHQYISRKLQADFYFADPYSSWQRGLSEYTNKLFRQYLPKKSNMNNYDIQYFVNINNKLNNRPRKLLGYKTPTQIFMANFKPN